MFAGGVCLNMGDLFGVGVLDSRHAERVDVELLIRDARPEDGEAISEVFAEYVRNSLVTFQDEPPASRDWCAKVRATAEAGWPFLVATLAGELVGYAYVGPWRPQPAYHHTVEDTIYLSPRHTGRGIGRRLLAELLRRAAAGGARQVIAVIADSGDPASAALHRQAGFDEVGRLRRVGFKHGKWIDTCLMQRDLDAL